MTNPKPLFTAEDFCADENGNECVAVCVLKEKIREQQAELERLRQLCKRVEELDDKNANLQAENEKLRARVAELEHERECMSACIGQMEATQSRLREALERIARATNPDVPGAQYHCEIARAALKGDG